MAWLSLVLRNWKWVGLALLLAWGVRVDHLRGLYKARWQSVAQEYAVFKVAIVDRMVATGRQQQAEKAAKEAEFKRNAENSDARYRDLSGRYGALRLRLARVPRGVDRAGQGDLSGGDGPRISEDAAAGGEGAATVTISAAEFEAFSAATAYAVSAFEWAQTLPVAPPTEEK